MRKAHKIELWLAAILINCGCSNDSFIDFRDWVILQGKEKYNQILSDPEVLVNLAPFGETRADLSSCIFQVYKKKTGTTILYPDSQNVVMPKIDLEELSEKKAAEMFPKLAAKSYEIFDWDDDY